MNLKLPKTYKLMLALAVVTGPFIWLVLTADGQRRSDLFLLHLMGHQPFNIALERLGPGVGLRAIEKQFPRVTFDCHSAASTLGERVCAAGIGSFNGIPARSARLWLAGDSLRAVRLDYRRRYHDLLIESLTQSFGEPKLQAAGGSAINSWELSDGVLLLPTTVDKDDDAALMWLASGA